MMFIIVRTSGGSKYARKIGKQLKRINHRHNWLIPSVNYFPESFAQRPRLNPRNTIIHARAAYPDGPQWMRNLVDLEDRGYRVINNTEVLRLTSNKLKCAIKMMSMGLPHPKTWKVDGYTNMESFHRILSEENINKFVVKPYTSMDQGANVEIVEAGIVPHQCTCSHCGNIHMTERENSIDIEELRAAIRRQPTSTVVVQEFVSYDCIYRVIVIGGRALPISWVDYPRPGAGNWKVSVCLNRRMSFVRNPSNALLRLAERTQEVIGGEINFIDIFGTRDGYVLSEINTACNLSIHEEKARAAGSSHWNIAGYIAEYLDRQARRM